MDRARSVFLSRPSCVYFPGSGCSNAGENYPYDRDDVFGNYRGVIQKRIEFLPLQRGVQSVHTHIQPSAFLPSFPSRNSFPKALQLQTCRFVSSFLPVSPWHLPLHFPKPPNRSVPWERRYAAMVLQRHSTLWPIAAFDVCPHNFWPQFSSPLLKDDLLYLPYSTW